MGSWGIRSGIVTCQIGTLSRFQLKIFSWMDEMFGIDRPTIKDQPI